MSRLILIGLVVALGAGAASAARAATPAELICASYKNAVAKETDYSKRQAMIKSAPAGCEIKSAPPKTVVSHAHPTAEAPPPPEPEMLPPLPPGTATVEQAKLNGNKAYQEDDYPHAMQWYRLAADQGDATAEDDIGEFYYYGHGVRVDYGQALSWYQLSAAKGNATAEDGIGALYARGQGVDKNYAQALTWFRQAAAQHNGDAENWIGYFYAHGFAVPLDMNQAQSWYARAAHDGAGQPQ